MLLVENEGERRKKTQANEKKMYVDAWIIQRRTFFFRSICSEDKD